MCLLEQRELNSDRKCFRMLSNIIKVLGFSVSFVSFFLVKLETIKFCFFLDFTDLSSWRHNWNLKSSCFLFKKKARARACGSKTYFFHYFGRILTWFSINFCPILVLFFCWFSNAYFVISVLFLLFLFPALLCLGKQHFLHARTTQEKRVWRQASKRLRQKISHEVQKVSHCAYQDQVLGKCKMSRRKISSFFLAHDSDHLQWW